MNVRSDLAMAYHMGYEDALAKRMPNATKAGVLNSYIRTDSERTETCHITRQFTCSECGHQYPTRNYEYYVTCDGRSAYAPLGYYVLDCKKPNYCPNCGRRIEQ